MIFEIDDIRSRTLVQWYDMKDNIDLSPSYQRSGDAWKPEDKAYLIDSIINGFDLPKFYFADFLGFANDLNEKTRRYAVIDGQQRLTAIFDFMEDKFALDRNFKYINDLEIDMRNLKYSEIQVKYPKIARIFDGYVITAVGVKTNDRGMITQMFMRLNRGAPLVTAELRNASDYQPVRLARSLAAHKVFKEKVAFSNSRLQHYEIALKILMMEYNGKTVSLLKKDIEAFVSDNSHLENFEKLNQSFERVITILDLMNKHMKVHEVYTKYSSLFPVVYWAVRQSLSNVSNTLKAAEIITKSVRSKTALDTNELEFKKLNRDINAAGSILRRSQIIQEISLIL